MHRRDFESAQRKLLGMSEMVDTPVVPLSMVVATGCATVVLASALAYLIFQNKGSSSNAPAGTEKEEQSPVELDREKYPGGHLCVYYGSQTGTAESFAQQLEREGPDHGFVVHVVDLEDVVELKQTLQKTDEDTGRSKAVFLVATYGEGEPTDNAAAIVNCLKLKTGLALDEEEEKKEAAPEDAEKECEGLDYCVFGLGNRQYEHYNAMGKIMNEGLARVGGNRILELGMGDDDNDLEGDFDAWKESVLWPGLKKLYVKDAASLQHKKEDKHVLPDCPYVVKYHDDKSVKPVTLPLDQVHGSSRHYFTAVECPITCNRELRSELDPGSTVHVEIDISKAKDLTYQTADNLGVLPINNSAMVESMASSLGLDLNAVFSLEAAPGHEWHGAPFPMPISLKECLSCYCDITGAPRRSDLKLLASYAKDPMDRKALLRMASKEGKAEYREKIVERHVGLVDLFKLCPSIETPLQHFLALCPRLHPRFYTIASSSSVHPQSVHLTVAVTQESLSDGSTFKGVCSSYLAGLQPESGTVRVFCRDSTFLLPKDPSRPILMIGPGTGVAPMRAMLQERAHQRKTLKLPVGSNVLYFGCKKSSWDYIYRDELEAFQKEGDLTQMYLAFSREQREKVYVQHLLAQNAKDTWDLIEKESASIFVCGGVKMGHDVTEALKDICCGEGGMDPTDAKAYMNRLAHEGRFVQELWA